MGLVRRLHRLAEDTAADPDRAWWAARLLRGTLLRTAGAHPHLPVLAEHVARAGPGAFDGRFRNRLRLPEPDRPELLRRLLPACRPPKRPPATAASTPPPVGSPATRGSRNRCSARGSTTSAGCAGAPGPPPPRPCCTPTAAAPWTTSPRRS
ncbi:hypothetical protein [Streptomyces sp. NPDC002044]|uniref:hypothetical protein n=1 Tax=Streptomyces sp. NPDC002044 TaxID=3154662 RepID=UPI00332C5AF5